MKHSTTSANIVPFGTEHLDAAVKLSQRAGWPHRREDWEQIMQLSDGIALLAGKRLVGTGFTTLYGPDVATLNMIIVKQSVRGSGIGQTIMHTLIEKAGGRELRLVATEAGLGLYEKTGFKMTGTVLQQQGIVSSIDHSGEANWCSRSDRDAIVNLDNQASGMFRPDLIDLLMNTGQIAVLHEHGALSGFAALRRFGHGYVAGPVVAATDSQAKSLLSFLFNARSGEFVRVDCDETTGLTNWLTAVGLFNVDNGISMTRNAGRRRSRADVSTYALASQALG